MEPEKIAIISKWIMKKFLEYKSVQERDVTQAEFAEYLGVSESAVSQWINKVQPPDKHSADLIAPKLGPEIYDLLGVERPNTIPLDQLPHAVRNRLTAAVYEVNSELVDRTFA